MKPLVTCLVLAAFALPAYAGEATIVETDDGYIVELSGDAADKPANKPGSIPAPASASAPTPASAPGTAAAVTPPPSATPPASGASQPSQPTPRATLPGTERTERPVRVRERRERIRSPRGTTDDGGASED